MKTRYLAIIAVLVASLADAQTRRPSHCIAIADAAPGLEYLQKASWREPIEDRYALRISYIDHSIFMIQTPDGLDMVTDYTGFLGAVDFAPEVATMNNAHGSHWTASPDRRITHVLEGWKHVGGEPAEHHLELGEVLIRNVTTDIRGDYGSARIEDNNSIFVFEAAGLCIAHLGHLHHEPTEEQYAALGRIDVLMAAVDGGLTVDLPTMIRIVERLKSSIILPMHWWSRGSLDRFTSALGADFDVVREGETSMEVSLRTLPKRPTVVVLEPRFLTSDD